MNSDIKRILTDFGEKWFLEFEAKNVKAITISKKRDLVTVLLVMSRKVISKNETLDFPWIAWYMVAPYWQVCT